MQIFNSDRVNLTQLPQTPQEHERPPAESVRQDSVDSSYNMKRDMVVCYPTICVKGTGIVAKGFNMDKRANCGTMRFG